MVTGRLGFALAIVGFACVAAAGSGAYLALHHVEGSQAASVAPAAATAAPVGGASAAVAETEAVVEEAPASSSPASSTRESTRSATSSSARRPVSAPPIRRAPEPVNPSPRETPPVAETTSGTSGEVGSAAGMTPVPEPEAATTGAPGSVTDAPVTAEAAAPRKTFEELTVPADAVLGLQIETTLTSERAKVEDSVNARVTRDVRVSDRVAIPAGTKVLGSVTVVDRGGKVKDKARLGIRFHTLVLADGTHQNINTDTIYREGASPAGESTAKIAGGAVAGAILGAILGGGKGAVIGGTAGAGGGTAAVMAGGRNAATVQAGSTMTARILEPVTITIEKEEEREEK